MILSGSNLTKKKSRLKPPITRWWFQIFYIFTPTWGNEPIWLIFFKWVETTNQISHQGYSLSPPEIWGQKWWFLDPPGREVVAHEAMYDSWSRFGTRGTQPRSPPNGGFSQIMARNILWVKDFFWKKMHQNDWETISVMMVELRIFPVFLEMYDV